MISGKSLDLFNFCSCTDDEGETYDKIHINTAAVNNRFQMDFFKELLLYIDQYISPLTCKSDIEK